MAIAQTGATMGSSGTAQPTTATVTFPAGALAGHVALVLLTTPPGAATVTDPSGWTVHVNGDGGNTKIGVWSKVLDAADITAGQLVITRSAGSSHAWNCVTWSGAVGFDAISAQQATATGTTSITIPAVTPVAANCLRVAVAAGRTVATATTANATPPAGWSEPAEASDLHATNQRRLAFTDSIQLVGQAGVAQATATATTDITVTYQTYSLTLAPITSFPATATPATVTAAAAVPAPIVSTSAPGFAQGFLAAAPFGEALTTPPPPPPPSQDVLDAPPRPIVEVGFTTDPLINGGLYSHWDDPTRGGWDVGLWAPDDIWTDVTPWLQSFTYNRGANRVEGPVLRYEAGTATIVLRNDDGRFHPLHTTGPYASAGRSQVRPMVPVRIRGSYKGVVRDLWRGFADPDGWDIAYNLSGDGSTATLTATDAQMVLASATRVARATPVGAGELSGARVHRILDSAGWPAADRLIDAGKTTLQGTTLEGDPWTELLLVQDTELGEIYVDAAGKVVFKDRHAILTEAKSVTSQATFGRFSMAGELPHAGLVPNSGGGDMRNVVRIARVGGVQQEARDLASVAEFLEKTHERTDLLMQTDTEALDYALYLLANSKDPDYRFAQIVVDPRAQPADLFPLVFATDFGDRITIRSRPPVVGLIERDSFIRGIAGEYRGTNQWRWTWTLQPTSKATGGIWDVTKWDQGTWVY